MRQLLRPPQSEGGLLWNDPALNIDWQVPMEDIVLSDKDKKNPLLSESDYLFDLTEDLYA